MVFTVLLVLVAALVCCELKNVSPYENEFLLAIPLYGNGSNVDPYIVFSNPGTFSTVVTIESECAGQPIDDKIVVASLTFEVYHLPPVCQLAIGNAIHSSGLLENKGIHITANDSVTVVCVVERLDGEGMVVFEVPPLSDAEEYYPVAPLVTPAMGTAANMFTVVASTPDSHVQIKSRSGKLLARASLSVFQAFTIQTKLSNVHIISDGPISVVTSCSFVTDADWPQYDRTLAIMPPPVTDWLKEYILYSVHPDAHPNHFSVLSTTNDTKVSFADRSGINTIKVPTSDDAVANISMSNGFFAYLNATKPVTVGQVGQESLKSPHSPVFLNVATLGTAAQVIPPGFYCQNDTWLRYVNIVTTTSSSAASILIDGAPIVGRWDSLHNLPYQSIRVIVDDGLHVVSADSNDVKFSVVAGGKCGNAIYAYVASRPQ